MMRFFALFSVSNRRSVPLTWLALSYKRSVLAFSSLLGCGIVLAALTAQAAETVQAKYSSLALELTTAELETFAKTGQQSELIESYGGLLGNQSLEKLRAALTQKVDIPPEILARFLSTPSGYKVLESLTEVLKAKSEGVDSVLALRTALILAAAQDESLTLLTLLRLFPDQTVQIDLEAGLKVFQTLQQVSNSHRQAIAEIKAQSQGMTTAPEIVTPYTQPGRYRWSKTRLNLTDQRPVRLQASGQAREFPLDLYVPQASSAPMPIVVLSHGLGLGLSAYEHFAEHLASHGFVVAVPEHPGSSAKYWQTLLANQTNQIANPQEFIDRPLDIQYTLDVLTELNQTHPVFKGQFDLDRVGLFGHSYGGYTALAIAGAPVDLSALTQQCDQDILTTLNLSLLLQCQAQTLSHHLPDLTDSRVKAVFVSHPMMSAVMGRESLATVKVPVAMISGGVDVVAPLVPEQMQPYRAMTGADRSFVLLEQADHFSPIGDLPPEEALLQSDTGRPTQVLLQSRQALRALGLHFFQTRLGVAEAEPPSFAALARSLNHPTFPIYAVDQLQAPMAAFSPAF